MKSALRQFIRAVCEHFCMIENKVNAAISVNFPEPLEKMSRICYNIAKYD